MKRLVFIVLSLAALAADAGQLVGPFITYPSAGVPVSTGTTWGTPLAVPTGALVGTTASQALTNKDLTAVTNTFPTLNQNTTGNAATATTATNIAGGSGGAVPYQSAAGTTAMLANGTTGQVLQSNAGTSAPSWVSDLTISSASLSTTLADAQSDTKAAYSSWVNSQIANGKNPDARAQGVNHTFAASGSTGETVATNSNLDNPTNNFTLRWRGSLPQWTGSGVNTTFFFRASATFGVRFTIGTGGALNLTLLRNDAGTTFTSTSALPTLSTVANTTHDIAVSVVRETASVAGSVTFYVDGVQLGNVVSIPANGGTISVSSTMYILGTTSARSAGTTQAASMFNRALSAADVLSLYRGGMTFADKWGNQTGQTSGTLVLGKSYRITTYVAGDDFTNIGAASNATGVEFTATGTTPTTWTNSSTLNEIGATFSLDSEGITSTAWYDSANGNTASYPAAGSSLVRPEMVNATQTQTISGAKTFSSAITSTVTTGTAPFTVASTTNVANLNASSLGGATFAAPGAIGSTTPSTGAFTSVTIASGATANELRLTQTTAPTCTANCGTGSSVVGTDTAGIVTMGATGTPTSGWVLTFNGTWPGAQAPACIVQSAKSGMVAGKDAVVVVPTTTTMTVTTNGTAPANSDQYSYICIGLHL